MMNEDEKIMLISFVGYWIVVIMLIMNSRKKMKTGLINIFVHIIYSSYYLYGLYYRSQSGTSLAWFVSLLFIIWTHTLINLGQFAYAVYKHYKKAR